MSAKIRKKPEPDKGKKRVFYGFFRKLLDKTERATYNNERYITIGLDERKDSRIYGRNGRGADTDAGRNGYRTDN